MWGGTFSGKGVCGDERSLVKVYVERNVLFNNGRTSREVEGRQNAGGLVINNGRASTVTMRENKVSIKNKVKIDKEISIQ